MARPLRIQEPGLTYHVHARGSGRMTIYRDDNDRKRFLEVLAEAMERYRADCHAHCLMGNHYHLVVTTSEANLSNTIKQVNGDYGQWWNRRHQRSGHVFQGRFGARIVQADTHLLAVCRYVVLNPVRAHMVASPGEWPWSSYRATAGLAPVPPFLKPDAILRLLGSGDGQLAARQYREFVGAAEAATATLPDAPVLGDDGFVARFSHWRERASREVPRRERNVRPPLETLFARAVTRAARQAQAAEARRLGHTVTEIAAYLQMDRSTIRRLIGVRPGKTHLSQT